MMDKAEDSSSQAQSSLQLLYLPSDPVEGLSAAALGEKMGGISEEMVRRREKDGELFSILRPTRSVTREYPAFQAWENIKGSPLKQVLRTLGTASGASAYGFFTSPYDILNGLTPIEVLCAGLTVEREIEPGASMLLQMSYEERLLVVWGAATAYAADLAG